MHHEMGMESEELSEVKISDNQLLKEVAWRCLNRHWNMFHLFEGFLEIGYEQQEEQNLY
jgi:hypothetical protein